MIEGMQISVAQLRWVSFRWAARTLGLAREGEKRGVLKLGTSRFVL